MKTNRRRNQRLYLFTTHGGRCFYCSAPTDFRGSKTLSGLVPGSKDHIIPKVKGGGDYRANLVWACVPCNMARSDQDFVEFGIKAIVEAMMLKPGPGGEGIYWPAHELPKAEAAA